MKRILMLIALVAMAGCLKQEPENAHGEAQKDPFGVTLSGQVGRGAAQQKAQSSTMGNITATANHYTVVVEWRSDEKAKPSKVSCATVSAVHPSERSETSVTLHGDGRASFMAKGELEVWCSIDGGEEWTRVPWNPVPSDTILNKYTISYMINGGEFPCRGD